MAKKTAGAGCLFIFGMPFLGAGLFVMYLALSPIMKNMSASSWRQTQARILEVRLESHRGSKGGTTYEATGKFEYEFAGQFYQSTQLSFQSGADNIGSYHEDLVNRLQRAQANGGSIYVYVNPNLPSEAVYDREVRWGMVAFSGVFGLVFALVGGGVMFGGIWAGRKAKKEKKIQEEAPDTPWTWNEKWQGGVIHSEGKAGTIGLACFAIFWNLFISVFWIAILQSDKNNPWFVFAFIGLFQLIGFGLLGVFLYHFFRGLKYGKSTLVMDQMPGVIGGETKAKLTIPKRVEASQGFEVNLKCIHKYTTGSGDNRSTHRDTLWETGVQVVHPENKFDMEKTELDFVFQVPFENECKETDPDKEIYWELKVEADVEGIDYGEEFHLPFFVTDESNEELKDIDVEHYGPELCLTELTNALAERRIRLVEKDQGLMIFSPTWRKPVSGFIGALLCTGSLVGSILFFMNGVWIGVIVAGFFALIACLIFHFTVLTSRKIQVSDQGITLFLNSPFYKSKISVPSDQVSLSVKWDSKTNDKETSWTLNMKGAKKTHGLLTGVKDKDLLRQLELKIEEAVSVSNL